MSQISTEDPPLRACKGTYAFVSLGCPKNLVDSERMLGLLQLDGYRLVTEPAGAATLMAREVLFTPVVAGLNVTLIVQVAPLARPAPPIGQVVVWANCPAFPPLRVMLDISRGTLSGLFTVTILAVLPVLINWLPKFSDVGDAMV